MKDTKFWSLTLWINGGVPAAILLWDALNDRLGADPVHKALVITGVLGIVYLTLSLTVTPVRKVTGWNSIIFARRTFGLLAFFHVCAHVALFFIDKHGGNVWEGLQAIPVTNYLFMGAIALLAMLPLALTSTKASIKRLGGKRWTRLHRLAYVAGAAAAFHYCLQGKFVSPWAWFYLSAIGALLAFRVGWWVLGKMKAKKVAVEV